MRRFLIGAASVLALCAAVPAYASSFVGTTNKGDGDESKYFFDKATLVNGAGVASFNGSTPGNSSNDNVDVTTVGTISNLGNGFGTIDGTDSGTDFLTSLTFTPHSGTSFDGMIFRGQLDVQAGGTFNGTINVDVTGVDNVVTHLTFTGLKADPKDFGDLGFEAANDTDLVQSVTISTVGTTYFKEFKQVEFSGVVGGTPVGTQGGVPEPAVWVVMLAGFGLAGTLLRRRSRALAVG